VVSLCRLLPRTTDTWRRCIDKRNCCFETCDFSAATLGGTHRQTAFAHFLHYSTTSEWRYKGFDNRAFWIIVNRYAASLFFAERWIGKQWCLHTCGCSVINHVQTVWLDNTWIDGSTTGRIDGSDLRFQKVSAPGVVILRVGLAIDSAWCANTGQPY